MILEPLDCLGLAAFCASCRSSLRSFVALAHLSMETKDLDSVVVVW